jgi:hypothetical protein
MTKKVTGWRRFVREALPAKSRGSDSGQLLRGRWLLLRSQTNAAEDEGKHHGLITPGVVSPRGSAMTCSHLGFEQNAIRRRRRRRGRVRVRRCRLQGRVGGLQVRRGRLIVLS